MTVSNTPSKREVMQARLDAVAERGWRLFVRRPGEAAREIPPTVAALFEAMGPEPARGERMEIEVVWRRDE